jgi:hypothetical protein
MTHALPDGVRGAIFRLRG